MPDQFAEFLDDISLHIEREAANLPAPVAEALLRGDSGLSTVDVLRMLAQPEKAMNLFARGGDSAAPFGQGGREREFDSFPGTSSGALMA